MPSEDVLLSINPPAIRHCMLASARRPWLQQELCEVSAALPGS
jgi:hypothetical protein